MIQALPVEERAFVQPGLQEALAPRPTAFETGLMARANSLLERARELEEQRARQSYWNQAPPAAEVVLARLAMCKAQISPGSQMLRHDTR